MNKILINMSLIIKSVEIIGLLTDCKNKLSGDILVHKYCDYLTEQ